MAQRYSTVCFNNLESALPRGAAGDAERWPRADTMRHNHITFMNIRPLICYYNFFNYFAFIRVNDT